MKNKKMILIILSTMLVLSGCTEEDVIEEKIENIEIVFEEDVTIIEEESVSIQVTEVAVEENIVVIPLKEVINLDEVRPNEAGKIMVIMYHSLGDKESAYVSTPEIFRKDLEKLNELGYVTVSLTDYVNNEMDIPAGKTPVVLTFDDGHKSNFYILEEDGEMKIDPNSAVGILDAFNKENSEFGNAATFFLNSNYFGQSEYSEYKLKYLIENGYDIGNHSWGHEDLSVLSGDAIIKTLHKDKINIESYLDGYVVNTLALPFGRRPKAENLKSLVYISEKVGFEYENIAVLNVGWNPTHSPITKNFDYTSINRVQAGSGDFQLQYWIDNLEANKNSRYISDGDVKTVTVPRKYEDTIDNDKLGDKELILYDRK